MFFNKKSLLASTSALAVVSAQSCADNPGTLECVLAFSVITTITFLLRVECVVT